MPPLRSVGRRRAAARDRVRRLGRLDARPGAGALGPAHAEGKFLEPGELWLRSDARRGRDRQHEHGRRRRSLRSRGRVVADPAGRIPAAGRLRDGGPLGPARSTPAAVDAGARARRSDLRRVAARRIRERRRHTRSEPASRIVWLTYPCISPDPDASIVLGPLGNTAALDPARLVHLNRVLLPELLKRRPGRLELDRSRRARVSRRRVPRRLRERTGCPPGRRPLLAAGGRPAGRLSRAARAAPAAGGSALVGLPVA